MNIKPITQEDLKRTLDYNPISGVFTWVYGAANYSAKAGDIAGFFDKDYYCIISILGKEYKAHRLAFLYMTGVIPKIVDHIDRNPSNNIWVNLRAATHSLNMFNTGLRSHNTSGYKGLVLDKRSGRWSARIGFEGKSISLGEYLTKELAIEARLRGEERYYGKRNN